MSQDKNSGPSEKTATLSNPISRFFSSIFKKLSEWGSTFKNWVTSFARANSKNKLTPSLGNPINCVRRPIQISAKLAEMPLTPAPIPQVPKITPTAPSSIMPPQAAIPSDLPMEAPKDLAARIEKWQKDFEKHGYPSCSSFIETMKAALDEISKGKDEDNVLSENLELIENSLNKPNLQTVRIDLQTVRIDPLESAITRLELELFNLNCITQQSFLLL